MIYLHIVTHLHAIILRSGENDYFAFSFNLLLDL